MIQILLTEQTIYFRDFFFYKYFMILEVEPKEVAELERSTQIISTNENIVYDTRPNEHERRSVVPDNIADNLTMILLYQ